ncbi:hypothetical protein FRB94_014159 [Tulasnella sp. JGI-2019a]|nr:hypothetical protein FRB94_014159 [Tulasnella sp. JGI-2019a]
MLVIGTLTNLQRGTLWGGFAEAFLIGIYSCLIVVTLWTPITTGRPLTIIGWTIIVIYCLTLCRVASDACVYFRTLFVNGGAFATLESIDFVFRAMQLTFMSVANTIADGLFCWRLYVIWLRNIRIVLFPAVLLMIHTIICIAAIVIDSLSVSQPHRNQHIVFILWLNTGEVATVLLYTLYTTVLIAGRLWWAGRESRKFGSLEDARGNRYQGAITALVQSGVLYLITMLLMLSALLTTNIVTISVVIEISASVNGILATLLVLQLNLYQEHTLKSDADGAPLTTGATFKFAGLETSSVISRE